MLSFIRQLNEGVAATDLQKLVFLHTMAGESGYYEFIPYKFGAYSFHLKEDADILELAGFVFSDNARIKATGVFSEESTFRIEPERGDALIRKSYRKYPYYAINSEITGRLFHGEELERFIGGRRAYVQSEQILFTIGYEGKSIEAFINALIQNDVRVLCDVRRNPLSRKFGFSKGKLEHIAQTVGIEYVHIPDLGIESDKRNSLETPEDYERLFDEYEKTLPSKRMFLDKIHSLLEKNTRVALMCFELDPKMCHRHVIRDSIVGTHRVGSADL